MALKGKTGPEAPKSRLGRGLSSLIRVNLPEEPPVSASGAVESASQKAAVEALPSPAAPSTKAEPVAERVVERIVEKVVTVPADPTGEPILVPIEHVRPNPHQPRKTFTEANLKELTESIKANGVIQPLVVTKVTGNGYELIAGERRLRASKLAGLSHVPVIIKTVDGLTQAQMALVENIQREDLNPLERAEGYRTLLQQLGLTQAELAGRMGEERSTIANYVRLLDLAEPVKRLLRDGLISLGHAKLLAGVADVLEQERLGKLVLNQGLSVRNLEKVILSGGAGAAPAVVKPKENLGREAHYQELEKSIARQLGMKVQVKPARGKGKGKITLHYSSLDQFDSLMGKLGVDVG